MEAGDAFSQAVESANPCAGAGFFTFSTGFSTACPRFSAKREGSFREYRGYNGVFGGGLPGPRFLICRRRPLGRRSFRGFGAPGFSVGKLVCSPAPFLKNFSLSFDALGALLGASAPPAFLLGNLFVLLRLFLKIFLCPSTRSGRAGAPTFLLLQKSRQKSRPKAFPLWNPPLRSRWRGLRPQFARGE